MDARRASLQVSRLVDVVTDWQCRNGIKLTNGDVATIVLFINYLLTYNIGNYFLFHCRVAEVIFNFVNRTLKST